MLSWESPSLLGSEKLRYALGCASIVVVGGITTKTQAICRRHVRFLEQRSHARENTGLGNHWADWLCSKKLEGGRFVRPVGDNPASRQSADDYFCGRIGDAP